MHILTHPFVPFRAALDLSGVFRQSISKADNAIREVKKKRPNQKKPTMVDVERMVDIIMAANNPDDAKSRRIVRSEVIGALGPESIDWVQLCRFRTSRIAHDME